MKMNLRNWGRTTILAASLLAVSSCLVGGYYLNKYLNPGVAVEIETQGPWENAPKKKQFVFREYKDRIEAEEEGVEDIEWRGDKKGIWYVKSFCLVDDKKDGSLDDTKLKIFVAWADPQCLI